MRGARHAYSAVWGVRPAGAGDYAGRIQLWDVFSGERRASLQHAAQPYEASVERLLFVPGYSRQQRQRAAAGGAITNPRVQGLAGRRTAPPGGSGAAAVTQAAPAGQQSRTDVAATPDAAAAAKQQALPQQQAQQPQQQAGSSQAAPPPASEASSSEAATAAAAAAGPGGSRSQQAAARLAAARALMGDPASLLLLSAGGDGLVRVWVLCGTAAAGQLLCTLPGAVGAPEVVSACCVDEAGDHVALGDSAGHVRVWDISRGVDTGSDEACCSSFQQVGFGGGGVLTGSRRGVGDCST